VSLPLKDYRTAIPEAVDVWLEIEAAASGQDKAAVGREVLKAWAKAKQHAYTVATRKLQASTAAKCAMTVKSLCLIKFHALSSDDSTPSEFNANGSGLFFAAARFLALALAVKATVPRNSPVVLSGTARNGCRITPAPRLSHA
jgi:hypothetical protein